MWCGEIREEEHVVVEGRSFTLLGPGDTRTATHFIYGSRAYPLGPFPSESNGSPT